MNPLTPYNHSVTLPQELLKAGGVIMTGVILCNKCRKKMDGVCSCGSYKCIISIYWRGKHYEYRRDEQGYILTYDRAVDKLTEISSAIKKGEFNPIEYTDEKVKERKFEIQIDRWLEEKEKQESLNELSPGTLKQYRGYINNYYPFFHGMDLREITLEQLTNFKDTLDTVKIKTRKNIMIALHNFFYWLRERGLIKEMPLFPKIKGDDSKSRKAIDVDLQGEALERIPVSHRDIIEFLTETGLRPGESCALLVEHIDMKHGIARIEGTFSGTKLRQTTKQKRKRVIPLSTRAFEIAVKNMQEKLPKQFLFINPVTNRHYTTNALGKIWRKKSGLEGITLYEAVRHSFGSQLIDNGVDVTIVKELMGHSDIRTTEKYVHMRMSKLTDVVNSRKVVKMVRTKNRSEIEAGISEGIFNNIQ
jgi:site-specific recombinase XerD